MDRDRIRYYSHNSGHIHLDYETIDVMEVEVRLTELDPSTLTELENGNAFRVPDSDKLYRIDFVTSLGEVVAGQGNTSHDVWKAVRAGVIKHGDKVAIEMEKLVLVYEDVEEGQRWVPIFSEALATLYTRVRFYEHNKVMIHKASNIIRVGDKDREFHRKF
jgi:hypothetical protein